MVDEVEGKGTGTGTDLDKLRNVLVEEYSSKSISEIVDMFDAGDNEIEKWLADREIVNRTRMEMFLEMVRWKEIMMDRLFEIMTTGNDRESIRAIAIVVRLIEKTGTFEDNKEKAKDVLRSVIDKIIEGYSDTVRNRIDEADRGKEELKDMRKRNTSQF